MIDKALEKEFTENDQNEATDAGSFNNSVAEQQESNKKLLKPSVLLNEMEEANPSKQLERDHHPENKTRTESNEERKKKERLHKIVKGFKAPSWSHLCK
ncbi:hypothetical protein NC652_029335 [Populus alba x Populus x berolinensis]|uniref:Uncharacterized protein n=1 Tax=Populus alba TaxID=43335 RepID=A0ACC4B9D4_POPAL|nr:hypothetical protein NC652_029335 [Populus alba x Populus x berolinensis]